MLETGDIAPDFTLPRDGGAPVTLSAARGQAVVLFFYPRDNTPGCTRESIEFSDLLPAFAEAGATVLGISKDSVASHEKFVAKRKLKTAMLSDEHGTVCDDYGVWVEKKMYGKTFMGIERSTFLIDAEGSIARIWRRVKVPGHVAEVLDSLQAL